MSSEDLYVREFSIEWTQHILHLLPKKVRKKRLPLITSILQEVKNIYLEDMQRYALRATASLTDNDKDLFVLHTCKKYISEEKQNVTRYSTFLMNRNLLRNKYFLCLEPVKIVVNVAQLKLSNVICNFKHYHEFELITLKDFQYMIAGDIKKGSLIITNQFYVIASRAIAETKFLKNITPKRLSKMMQCITNMFVQQILNIKIKSIDHMINSISVGCCPQIKLQLIFQNNDLVIHPSIQDIFSTFHNIIDSIENIAQDLIPFEEWLNVKTNSKYIKIQLPSWYIKESHQTLEAMLNSLFQPINNHIENISKEFYPVSARTVKKKILSLVSRGINFDLYLRHIQTYNVYLIKANAIVDNTYYTVGKLEQSMAKEMLKKQSSDVINIFLTELIKYHQEFNRSICTEFENIRTKALDIPKSAKSLIKLTEYISYASKTLVKELEQKIQESIRMLSALLEMTTLTKEHIDLNGKTINWLSKIEPIFSQNNTLCEAMKSELEDDMQRRINLLNSKVDDIVPDLKVLNNMDDINRIDEYVEYYKNFLKQVNDIDQEMQIINEEERLFRFPETEFPKVLELKDIIMPFHSLIYIIYQWQKDNAVWLNGPFEWLDATVIEKKTLHYFEKVTEMSKTFKSRIKLDVTANKCFKFSGIPDDPEPMQQPAPLKLCWQALKDINDFKKYLPLVICLCNPALQTRHWIEMSSICNFDLTPNAGTSLKKVIALDLMENIEKYQAISTGANRELALQKELSEMIKEWDGISFEIKINIESGMLNFTNLDDIELLLEKHFIKIEEMKASNFVKPIISSVTNLSTSLIRIQGIINQWVYIQYLKSSLASIFSYPTMEKRLPEETAAYIEVEQVLLKIQNEIIEAPNFQQINDPLLLNSLCSIHEKLEKTSKRVKDYMETKRLCFPRFFFLSDREIERILYESDNIEKYFLLNKCFEGIQKIKVKRNKYISSVISDSGEELQLCKFVSINVNFDEEEKWLINLEKEVNTTIQTNMLQCSQNLNEKSIDQDILSLPSMIIINAFQIHWTAEVHRCFVQFTPELLRSLHLKYSMQLTSLINETKKCPTRKQKDLLMSLIIVVNNQKDIIELLLDRNISKSTDFEWVAQLQYYLDDKHVKVSIFNSVITFGYEYRSYNRHIVNTPLTERCFHVLMQAYKYHLYGVVKGPSATGKTETIKSLAKAIAVPFYIFNCTDSSSYSFLCQIFKGLLACGAWLCFENFNKLEMKVVSAITQHIIHISQAVSTNLKSITFEGSLLKLNRNGYICIVTNLSQCSCDNIPDNLKILFRTVNMIVPDMKRIAEIELFAGNFSNSKVLATKLVTLYKALSEQVWCKSCNTFSMYSVKTVIKTAVRLKSNFPDEDETMLFLRSLIGINLPKLCDIDVIIFKTIVHDIFPNIVLLPPNYSIILETLETVAKASTLHIHDIFKLKIIQTFESMLVHQGIIIAGDPFVGKTMILRNLANILQYLHEQGNENGANVKVETIVPGVVDNNQLFGYIDTKLGIWKDGICSKVFRFFSQNNSFNKNWIIFDGLLNNAWFENLYTVLDTDKVLYLTSGERISITDSTSIIFETMNLLEISPTVLSRCGIIYIESRSINWMSHIKSSIAKNDLYIGYEEALHSLFDWVINPCLQFVRKICNLTTVTGQLHFVMSVLNLFEIYLEDACTENTEEKGKISHFLIWAQVALLSSVIWGFGGNLDMESHVKFNDFCVSLWSGTNEEYPKPDVIKHFDITLPNEGLIQDNYYIFKGIGNWKCWGDLLKNEKILDTSNYSEVFVPTINTMKLNHILLKHIKHRKPFLLYGDISIGKTSFMQYFLKIKLPQTEYTSDLSSFNSLNTVKKVQVSLLSKLNKIRKRHYSAPKDQFCVHFIDDLNVETNEYNEICAILELIRQYLTCGYIYDINEPEKVFISDVMFVFAIMNSTKSYVCPRFLRHFNIYTIYKSTTDTMFRIFSNALFSNLKRNLFAADVLSSVTNITNATLDMYDFVVNTLRPIPIKCQYCFSIRDISRVINGCSLLHKESVETKITFLRLWVHEIWRVFGDRISDRNDKEWLFLKVKETAKNRFKEMFETAFDYLPKFENNQITQESFHDLMFSNFMDSEKIKNRKYEEISSMKTLENKVVSYLNEYNSNFKQRIDIVVTHYVLECLIKISRILITPGGSLLIISNVGIGKKSVIKLATYIQQQKLFEPSVQAYSNFSIWRVDLKMALQECAKSSTDLTLFLTDNLLEHRFIQDINSLLASGEIPDLYSAEERRSIVEMVRLHAQQGNKNAEMNISSVMNYFTEECKKLLHVVLCFSPTNDSIRSYLCMRSELIKYCTINWYEIWPKDALMQIGIKHMQSVNIKDSTKVNVINACIQFHDNAQTIRNKYYQEIGRRIYVPISSFLHISKLYARLVSKKQEDIITTRNRFLTGLKKLELAAKQVEEMKATLTVLKPQLELSAQQTVITMKEVENENISVEKATVLVKEEEEIANKKAEIAGTLKIECEADLAVAIPILEDAVAALNTLKPTDITLVKAMKNPPDTVKLVMAAVCVMLNVPADKTVDPVTGKKYTDFWGPSKRILGDMNFLQNLKEYDKDDIPSSVMQIIKKTYMTDNNFKPHIVAKASSAAEGLCKWVRAMVSYDDVAKVVAPKKKKLLAAQTECNEAEAFLNEKRRTLSALNAKLAALNNSLQETLQQKLKLEKEVKDCTSKLKKAESLIASLSGEKDRWMQFAKNLQVNYDNLIGDMILSCGIITYMAPYNIEFRNEILLQWKKYISDLKIPYTEDYSFINVLGDESVINNWYICGLPKNRFSTENAIIAKYSDLWSLFIDSQNQANQWIKQIEKKNDLKVIKLTDPNYISIIEYNVENGKPILIENVGENLDILIDPFLRMEIYKDGEFLYLDTGKNRVKYSSNFRLYITTRLHNPEYSCEVFSKLLIIDFSIPNEALQDRLLDIVISKEKPDHQEKFEVLLRHDATNKKILKQQEDNILSTLSSTTTNILEDDNAIKILDSSKNLSLNVIKKQETIQLMAMEMNKFRDSYLQFVKYCAGLFNTLNTLSSLNHMYRFSFSWFMQLYTRSIQTANRSVILKKRLQFLKFSFTQSLYSSVHRCLSEKHKILYSFLLCSQILLDDQQVTEEEIKFFMSSNIKDLDKVPNSAPAWLPSDIWKEIYNLTCSLPIFHGLTNDISNNNDLWEQYYNSQPLQNHLLPKPWLNKLTLFQKLILVRILRPDQIIIQIRELTTHIMGDSQIYSLIHLKISQAYAESSCLIPLIFILPSCFSPWSLISTFASRKGYSSKLISMSMGPDQEQKAEHLIRQAQREGGWIFLQNCHLVTHWMAQLEQICENLNASDVSLDFRLWLSSNPTEKFPISILQNSIKIANDYPLDFKQNFLNIYESQPIANKTFFEGCPGKDKIFSKLLFGLCLFHVACRERTYFGTQGWNIPYNFDHSDLHISVMQLQDLINDTDIIPFDTLLYLIGECNYNGKVIDNFEQKCLRCLLNCYFNADMIDHHQYTSSNKIQQLIPERCEYFNIIQHIKEMPLNLSPEILGSNENGIITRNNELAMEFLSCVSYMNSNALPPDQDYMKNQVLITIDDINDKLYGLFEITEFEEEHMSVPREILENVLHYEVMLLKQTLKMINDTLNNVKLALTGYIILSDSLNELIKDIHNNKVPHIWTKLQNNQIDNLSNYIDNLLKRITFVKNWILRSRPDVIWFDVLASHKMLLSAILLTFSKHHNIPIEEVTFDFNVSTTAELSNVNNNDTYVICGLHLSGARWNCEKNILEESLTNIFSQKMPPIRFKCSRNVKNTTKIYECPVYISDIRHTNKDIETHLNNYVISIGLNTDVHYTHWIKCGTALYCHVPH